MDGPLGLDGGNGCIYVLGNNITAVQHAASHVLAVTGIAFHHLVGGFEAGIGDLGNTQLFVIGFLGRDDRSIRDQREVDTWVGDEVGLELGEIDIEGTVKTEGGCDG